MAERTVKFDSHVEREILNVCLCVPLAVSFIGGRQRSTYSENGVDWNREGFFACSNTHKISRLWSCVYDFGPSLERTCSWGRASGGAVTNSSATDACASQNTENDQRVERVGREGGGGAFERCPRETGNTAGRELRIPQPSLWRILCRRLQVKPHRLLFLQVVTHNDCSSVPKCNSTWRKTISLKSLFWAMSCVSS
jgi:hypothetical protein